MRAMSDTLQVEAARIPDRDRLLEELRENGLEAKAVNEIGIEVIVDGDEAACERAPGSRDAEARLRVVVRHELADQVVRLPVGEQLGAELGDALRDHGLDADREHERELDAALLADEHRVLPRVLDVVAGVRLV